MMNAYTKPLAVAVAALIVLFAALIQPNAAHADACTPVSAGELCVNAPGGAPSTQCQELASYLVEFQQVACGLTVPDPGYYPNYAASLTFANSNMGPDLLTPWNMQNLEVELDRLTEIGVNTINVSIGYPLLTPAFHTYLASVNSSYDKTVEDYVDFYAAAIAKIRARSARPDRTRHHAARLFLGEPVPVFRHPQGDGAKRDPTTTHGRASAGEPDHSDRTGPRLADPAKRTGNVQRGVRPNPGRAAGHAGAMAGVSRRRSQSLPRPQQQAGRGRGVWEDEEYIDLFAPMAALDFIDLHIFPARSTQINYFDEVLARSDLVSSYDSSKTITLGQAWLYKATADELAAIGVISPEVLSRDVFSYWQPLDSTFLELFNQVARAKQFETITPWGTWYFFSYLDYRRQPA
ncbi:MAG: hypothetical protein R2844_19560 [Caldilineales bacterium]